MLTQNSRIVLGTAQLGMPYGIANNSGKPDQDITDEIILSAWNSGCREFDTAQVYGDSESVLGCSIEKLKLNSKIKVITKPAPDINFKHPEIVAKSLKESISRLNIKKLYGVLLHDEKQLDDWDNGLGESLIRVKNEGLTENIGVSVYSPSQALRALSAKGLDIIQIPTNIFDTRFKKAGVFEKAHEFKKIIYVRSIYLQGLLLMHPDNLPVHLELAKPYLEELHLLASEYGEIKDLARQFVLQSFPDARLVIGMESPEQVSENFQSEPVKISDKLLEKIDTVFDSLPEKLVNPSLWNS
jgi:aryl-alcohol dehydrogenase-like predicted oxidoreductase